MYAVIMNFYCKRIFFSSVQVIEELRCEIERLRTAEETARKRSPSVDPQTAQTAELQATIRQLREENKSMFPYCFYKAINQKSNKEQDVLWMETFLTMY